MELSEARAACDDAMNKRTLQRLSGYGGERISGWLGTLAQSLALLALVLVLMLALMVNS